jgi:hypothetical protein
MKAAKKKKKKKTNSVGSSGKNEFIKTFCD